MDIVFFGKRIICIPARVMKSVGVGAVVGLVVAGCVALGCAIVAGFWHVGESLGNAFPSRDGFRGRGGVNLQAYHGVGGVEAGQQAGAYTYGVGQAVTFPGEAVGLAGDAEGARGVVLCGECAVKCCENAGGGVGHGFSLCQQRVDTGNIVAYRPASSGASLSINYPFALRLGPRSNDAGAFSERSGIFFAGLIPAFSLR